MPALKTSITALLLLVPHLAHAGIVGDTELDAVIVTAPAIDGTARTVPHNVTVIEAADIERSTAQTLGELLDRLANLHLRGFDGNDRRASIDIRGMGDTAQSNVIIVVDGIRLNETDLSGADLTTIPLAQIERIEVLRGGGSVRYGDGAVGGVIDIRTRARSGSRRTATASVRLASANLREASAYASATVGPWRVATDWRRLLTDGYRDNGSLDTRTTSLELGARFDHIDLWLRTSDHRDHAGLPGPVDKQAFDSGERGRRSTRFPHDYSETHDRRHALGFIIDLGDAGSLELQYSRRMRDNPWIMGFNPLLSAEQQRGEIRTRRDEIHLAHLIDFELGQRKFSLRSGYDRLDGSYLRRENGRHVVDSSTALHGEVLSHGYYTQLTAGLGSTTALTLGYRDSRFATREREDRLQRVCEWIAIPFPPFVMPTNCSDRWQTTGRHQARWSNSAAELGLSWQPSSRLTLFAGGARHFRSPNIDELMLAADGLAPQRGTTVEGGMRYVAGRQGRVALTVFRMDVRDEIHYGVDPLTNQSVNRNHEAPTRRLGLELEARWQAHPRLRLDSSIGYVRARFLGRGTEMPHVPRLTASMQMELMLPHAIRWTVAGRHVGRRYDGNDLDNTLYPTLPAYTIWDSAVHARIGQFEISAGINNIADKAYSTLAYSGSVYPMAGRTAYIRISADF